MSLSRMILRLATVRALTGETMAGDAVFDSIVDPDDQRVSRSQRPVIVVYTDDHESQPEGRAHQVGGESACDLVIEIAIAGTVQVPSDDGETSTNVVAPAETDAAREYLLDLLERQISVALTAGTGPWADLWRAFVVKVPSRTSRRGVFEVARLAARQVTMTCDILLDPPAVGYSPTAAWAQAIATFEGDPEVAPLAPVIRAAIAGRDGSIAAAAAADLGVSRETIAAMGVGPLTGDDADEATLETIETPAGTMESE